MKFIVFKNKNFTKQDAQQNKIMVITLTKENSFFCNFLCLIIAVKPILYSFGELNFYLVKILNKSSIWLILYQILFFIKKQRWRKKLNKHLLIRKGKV